MVGWFHRKQQLSPIQLHTSTGHSIVQSQFKSIRPLMAECFANGPNHENQSTFYRSSRHDICTTNKSFSPARCSGHFSWNGLATSALKKLNLAFLVSNIGVQRQTLYLAEAIQGMIVMITTTSFYHCFQQPDTQCSAN